MNDRIAIVEERVTNELLVNLRREIEYRLQESHTPTLRQC